MSASIKAGDAAIKVDSLWKVFTKQKTELNVDDKEEVQKFEDSQEEVIAVRDTSFDVKKGEVFVVMGLSGSGKSTLIRCLLRLIEPSAGEIYINGQEVTSLDKQQLTEFRRKEAAMVFQHYGLLPHRNVMDNVSFGLKLQGVPKQERYQLAKEMIERVGLSGFETYFPAQLSGGMQQRVGIARALVNDPPILLMDEPFSGLDPLIRREMQDELLSLQEHMHKTIFFVTHDLDEAVRLGNRMAVMKDGQFIQAGTCEEIISNPADEYVERFVQDKREHLLKTGAIA